MTGLSTASYNAINPFWHWRIDIAACRKTYRGTEHATYKSIHDHVYFATSDAVDNMAGDTVRDAVLDAFGFST